VKTVCIVGLAPSSRHRAFFDQPEGTEFWCLNNGHSCFRPEEMAYFTRWFQVHPFAEIMEDRLEDRERHLDRLRQMTIPVYMQERHEDIPRSVAYPRQEVIDDLGFDYFTSSIAYMLALALYEQFECVKLYGVSMEAGGEYIHERPCVEFILGIAHARGVEVVLPEDCALLRGQAYALEVNISTGRVKAAYNTYCDLREDRRSKYNESIGREAMLRELVAERPRDKRLGERLEAETRQKWMMMSEFNAYAGAAQGVWELYLEAIRPENERDMKLRNPKGQLLLPGPGAMSLNGKVRDAVLV